MAEKILHEKSPRSDDQTNQDSEFRNVCQNGDSDSDWDYNGSCDDQTNKDSEFKNVCHSRDSDSDWDCNGSGNDQTNKDSEFRNVCQNRDSDSDWDCSGSGNGQTNKDSEFKNVCHNRDSDSDWDRDDDNSNNHVQKQNIRKRNYADSDWDNSESDNDCVPFNAKRFKAQQFERFQYDKIKNTEEVPTDATGHMKWYPGQKLKHYEVQSVLGEGTFGRVFKVKIEDTDLMAALKFNKTERSKHESVMAEITALEMIRRRDPRNESFCVHMWSWFIYGGHTCIVFPLLGISVYDFLKDNNFVPFLIDEVREISFQLCTAVAFLHKNGIIHTDLKPENIMFVNSSYTTEFCKQRNVELRRLKCTDIKLSDFGLAVFDGDYHPPVMASRPYRPPEAILRIDWTNTSDIWSIGCIVFELYMGYVLFPTNEDKEQLAMMQEIIGKIPPEMASASPTSYFKNGQLDWNWSEATEHAAHHSRPMEYFPWGDCGEDDQLFHLVGQMLIHEPDQRMSLSEALSLPFFEKEKRRMINS